MSDGQYPESQNLTIANQSIDASLTEDEVITLSGEEDDAGGLSSLDEPVQMITRRRQRYSTPHVNEEEERFVAIELARLKASKGTAEPLWVEKFSALLPTAQSFLKTRSLQAKEAVPISEPITPEAVITGSTMCEPTTSEGSSSSQRSFDNPDEEDPIILDVHTRTARARTAIAGKYNKKWTIDQFCWIVLHILG